MRNELTCLAIATDFLVTTHGFRSTRSDIKQSATVRKGDSIPEFRGILWCETKKNLLQRAANPAHLQELRQVSKNRLPTLNTLRG